MREWMRCRLADVATITASNVDKKVSFSEERVRLCNYMDVYGNDRITGDLPFMVGSASRREIDRFQLRQGDVVITKDSETPDDIGVPAVVTEDLANVVCGYHLALLRPDMNRVDPRFLGFQIRSDNIRRHYFRWASGSTRYGLTQFAVADTPLVLPPLPEQRLIAEMLDTVDEAIRKTEAIIAKLGQVKQGLLHDLLTRGIDDNGQLRDPDRHPEQFKDSPLGRIPKEWSVNHLLRIVSLPSGQLDPRTLPYRHWPLLAPDHIETRSGRLLSKESAAEQNAVSGKYRFEPGDVLYSKIRPYLRKATIADFPGLCSADMYPLKPSDALNSRFLLAVILGEHFSRFAESVSMRSGFPKINREELSEYRLALPPRFEQERMASVLDGHDKRIDREEKDVAKLRLLKQGLMDDLLTGRVRVTSLLQEAAT